MRRMEMLSDHHHRPKPHNKYGQYGRSQSEYNIADTSHNNAAWDRSTQGVNKKLMRLAVDSKRQSRQSLMYDESLPRSRSSTVYLRDETSGGSLQNLKITQLHDCDNARFPRMEVMSHFHYNNVDLDDDTIQLVLCGDENDDTFDETGQALLVKVTSKQKSWILKRSVEDFIGLDRQIHRCIYDRRYSLLPQLGDLDTDDGLSVEMVNRLQDYLSRFSKLVGNNVNCGPILNWLELDNHGNHLVVMEADDSAINVPAIAAGRVIKRYQAQAADEITLDVGEFLSIIDMPPVEETIWWRGKKGYEVGFFPSHCIEILGVKEVTEKAINDLTSRPVSKRRGKFISFLRFFFKSRPSKDELMANGILRERVFGCDLGERLALVGREIPLVLEMCSAVIEEYGIVDGIYRLSGILSNLQRLRIAFDSGDEPPDLLDTRYLNDIHCISSLLKTYFRELPNPLFTHELYEKFVAAIDKTDDTEKTVAFHHVIQRLPPPHYRTMHALLRHLNFCAQQAKLTNMTAKNLAIVWAPNLLRPNMDSVSALTEFRTQAIIVEYMIRNVDVFFNSNLASAAIAYYPETVSTNSTEDTTTSRPNYMTTNMGGTKLISLEEARLRLHNRVNSQQAAEDAANNSPRHKIRSMAAEPPQLSAAPISPLPTLLSLEEAQARTKTTNLAVNLRSGGEAEVATDNNRSNMGDESPKRNKKWFGLFSKSRTVEEEGGGPKATGVYRKKGSGRHNLVISSPTSIPTSVGMPSSSSSSSSSDSDDCDSRWGKRGHIVPLSQAHQEVEVVEDLEVPVQAVEDGDDDIMSAVVSVSNKYTSMPCRRNESHRPNHRRSFTIGEPSELRRLTNYFPVGDANSKDLEQKVTSETTPKSFIQYDTKRESRKSLGKAFEKMAADECAKGKLCDSVSNVPAKKVRTFSPDNYTDDSPPKNMETSNVNGEETTTTEPNNIPCSESSPPPLPVDEPSLPEPRASMDECVDEVKKPTTNRNSLGETIFQLVAVPRHENEAKSDDSPQQQQQQPPSEKVDDAEGKCTGLPQQPTTTQSPSRHEQKTNNNNNTSRSSVQRNNQIYAESQQNENASVQKLIEKAKEIDQKYKIRQMSRSAEEKQKIEAKAKRRDTNTEYNESYIGSKIVPVSSTLARLKAELASNKASESGATNTCDVEDRCQVTKSCVEPNERKHSRSKSNERVNDVASSPTSNNPVERSYSLSVKDKVTLFDNQNRSKPRTCSSSAYSRNSDSHTTNDGEKRRTSMERGGSTEQIRSTQNLYLHTEHSARASPSSLNSKYKNGGKKEKECEKCENNRRSAYSSQGRTNSEGSHTRYSNNSNINNSNINNSNINNSNSNNNNNNNSNSNGCNENRQPSRNSGPTNTKNIETKNTNTKNTKNTNNQSNNRRKTSREKQDKFEGAKMNGESNTNRKTTKSDRSASSHSVHHRTKDHHPKPPLKPRPLSEAQKHDREPRGGGTPLLSNFQQPPFFTLLHKSVSDNYLHTDGGMGDGGRVIGRFPLTLKNGSSMHQPHNMFDHHDVIMKKRTSRPLSMYDNVRHSYYDNMTAVRYDLV